MKILVIAVLMMVAGAQAQTAKVIALTSEEAKEAAQIQAQRAELDKRAEALRVKIEATHIRTPLFLLVGWDNGFIFSDDFKFIVPKPLEIQASNIFNTNCGTGTFTPLTPFNIRPAGIN